MKTPSQSDKNGVKLQFIKVNQMYDQMTIYGQNEGYFKPEKNECIATGARTKFHKIKIVVFFYLVHVVLWRVFVTKYVIATS